MIVLIDGFSVAFRAFYALPETLMTSTGTPTNVIHGFLSMINKVVNDYDPKQIIITWDLPGKTFRNDIYKEYKANRSPAPDNFNVQIPLLHELIESFNIPQVSVEGHEADDVLGSLSNLFNQNNENVLIVTGDRDTFQLITKKTNILYTKRGITDTDKVDESFFKNKFGIKPSQYIEYLALKGDPSDNIPGLAGVGEKTAISLLQQYENIDRIYKNLEELTPKLKNSFEENKEILFISKELATIKTDLDLELPTVKTSETAYLSDQVLLEAQEKVLNLELNKYTISQDENIEVEIENDSKEDISENKKLESKYFTKQIAFNAIPHIDSFLENGYTKEEQKTTDEIKKILDKKIKITSTCVRIPVLVSHSISTNVEFNKKCNLEEIRNVLSTSPGCKVVDEHKDGGYITPVEAENKYETFISRIRKDDSQSNSINLWVASDNLLKGAALNAVEIAESLIKKNLHER